jgi:hypothetical protein
MRLPLAGIRRLFPPRGHGSMTWVVRLMCSAVPALNVMVSSAIDKIARMTFIACHGVVFDQTKQLYDNRARRLAVAIALWREASDVES